MAKVETQTPEASATPRKEVLVCVPGHTSVFFPVETPEQVVALAGVLQGAAGQRDLAKRLQGKSKAKGSTSGPEAKALALEAAQAWQVVSSQQALSLSDIAKGKRAHQQQRLAGIAAEEAIKRRKAAEGAEERAALAWEANQDAGRLLEALRAL